MGKGKDIMKGYEPSTELRYANEGSFTAEPSVSLGSTLDTGSHIGLAQEIPVRHRYRGYSLRQNLPHKNATSSKSSMGGSSSSQVIYPLEERSEKRVQTDVFALPSSIFELEATAWPPTLERQHLSRIARQSLWHTRLSAIWHAAQEHLIYNLPILQRINTLRHTPTASTGDRHIILGQKIPLVDDSTKKPFIDNTIRSNKYTIWTFFPRQLLAQFSKLANVYFLCVSILQLIPGLSTTGTYTTIVPLMFFVGISMTKEGYEDWQRHRLDKAENTSTAVVLDAVDTTSEKTRENCVLSRPLDFLPWRQKKWQEIQVGDIIQLVRNDPVPADLILLQSSNENGIAHIETTALDGETNLKSKTVRPKISQLGSIEQELIEQLPQASSDTRNTAVDCGEHRLGFGQETAPLQWRSSLSTPQEDGHHQSTNMHQAHMIGQGRVRVPSGLYSGISVTVESPNLNLYDFNGKMAIRDEDVPLTNSEVMYRGSILRNTSWVLGLVVYSGEECKIRMNASRNTRVKVPRLQGTVNRVVLMIVAFVLSLAIGNTVAYQLWKPLERKSWYLTDASVTFVPIFVSFIIIFNTMIPLSLYVSLEIVKVFQMFFMQIDLDMYDCKSNTPMESRTTTINEELGQVNYVLSDKTGTLTNNSMSFQKMSVLGLELMHKPRPQQSAGRSLCNEPVLSPEHPQTEELISYIQAHPSTAYAKAVGTFLLSMALCHTVIPEVKSDGSINYQATSPDEAALVIAAEEMGYILTDRRGQAVTIKRRAATPSEESEGEVYQILDVIEFSSERKRMSVIVKTPQGQIAIFCKGADSTVTRLLRLSTLANDKAQEVTMRAEARKSIEAKEYMRRSLDVASRRLSLGRSSFGLERLSLSSVGRPSFGANQAGSYVPLEESLSPKLPLVYGRASLHEATHASMLQTRDFGSTSEDSAPQFGLIPSDDIILANCLQQIHGFAAEGLRTLLYGHRWISAIEYTAWKKKYHEASISLVNRQAQIRHVAEAIEHSLELTGASAIEDKLQDGVPETIDLLRRANIKVAMLTGDKSETAINVGRASNLILSHSHITVLDDKATTPLPIVLTETVRILSTSNPLVSHSVIVVDGSTLSTITSSPALASQFVHLFARLTSTCICTRLSPSQKAELVTLLRRANPDATTLAIGDGSNDIAMIREAHIGIGITAAKEGLQAARTADYTVAQFRFLAKLLLVHGRWNYIRTCKYVLGTFWKEMLFYMTQAWWQIHCGWTGTSLYESWSLTVFNTLFTSLPVIFLGIFEQDHTKEVLLSQPELYSHGQRGRGFSIPIYLISAMTAIAESALISFSLVVLYAPTTQTTTTSSSDLFALGTLSFTACILAIAIKLQFIETSNKTWTAVLAIGLSVGGCGIWNIILAKVYSNNSVYDVKDGLFERWGTEGAWWLVLLLVVVEVWLFEFIILGARVWLRGTAQRLRTIQEVRDHEEDE